MSPEPVDEPESEPEEAGLGRGRGLVHGINASELRYQILHSDRHLQPPLAAAPGEIAAPVPPPAPILSAIVDLSPDAIAINRARDGVFVAVNQGFTALTGWSAAETQGRALA